MVHHESVTIHPHVDDLTIDPELSYPSYHHHSSRMPVSVSLEVVMTNLLSLLELVDDDREGFLFEIGLILDIRCLKMGWGWWEILKSDRSKLMVVRSVGVTPKGDGYERRRV